ncbi:MAG: cation-translocating P-type ATPase [Patescibacteria group bacterium]|nr:cation-translocating P-type ATPase [Patescibacteria group bacterium]
MKDWHSLKINECFKHLKSGKEGLTAEEAEKRLGKYGRNELPKQKILAGYKIFFSQFKNALIYILLFTGVISIFVKAYKEAIVIFGAVIINVVIGFIQENKANRAIIKLRELVEHKAYVLRDGNEISIESSLVTVGDIIVIKTGNRLPADARIIEASDLLINESMLTGESIPAHKKTETVPKGASLADRNNMAFAGTIVVSGQGKAVITATGKKTEIGKIADMVESAKEENTPLQLRLMQFSRFLGILFSIICTLIVMVGLWQGREFVEILETGVAVGVASIPEGLIVAVTFILALGMQKILKERALTRKLVAVETLGSTTVICSDKTGTLTEGKMHVAHIVIGENEYEIGSMGSRQDSSEAKTVSLALEISMMCNDALIENPDDELLSWRFIGSPTEVALLKAAIQSGLNKEKLLEKQVKIAELPFTSEKKYMMTLHETGNQKYTVYEKGAPELLLNKSTHFYHKGKKQELKKSELSKLKASYESLTSRGLRVIGVAERNYHLPSRSSELDTENIDWSELDQGFTFVGFIALKDPLRPEAADTIKTAIDAGIRTVIITGDHKLTAKAIAGEVGLKIMADNIIIGEELDKVDDDRLKELVKTINVYARVSPHHKLRIVKALQARGEVVAMTGDGINDSPALKVADIGISLGTGTDIAKETSDIVLLDNNFKTIISAVRQGRIIFKNIRKVIVYLISDSFSEILLVVGSIMLNTPLAILPAQILWINIVNDSMPHFSLAFERDHGEVMQEKPISKSEPLVNKRMKVIVFGVGIFRDLILFAIFYYFYLKWQTDASKINYLATFIFITLGLKSLISIFSFRSFGRFIWNYNPFSNKYLVLAVLASTTLLVLSVYWPPLRDLLGNSKDIDYKIWLGASVFAVINLMLLEIVKVFYISKTKKSA